MTPATSSPYPHLLSPFHIGSLLLRNRVAMSAMGGGLSGSDGRPNERLVDYLVERARGGVALVVVEATGVVADLRYTPRQPMLAEDDHLPAWEQLTSALHAEGARVAVQLHHPGKAAFGWSRGPVVAPSPVPWRTIGRVPRELTPGEIDAVVASFGAAARRARLAGCDAVEIHAGHGYLFEQFLSPGANLRTDEYGGALERRSRFLLETVAAIRAKAGADFPLLVRLSADAHADGGITIDETLVLARWLEKAGVAALRVSGGSHDQRLPVMIPPVGVPRGLFWEHSARLKEVVRIPVDAVGRINSPELAERILASGQADFVSLGRPLLADPAFVVKSANGRPETIRPCIACNQGCIDRVLDPRFKDMTCLVNPAAGRESPELVRPARRRKRLVVVGAGPGGLTAAILAAERGHEVTLLERAERIGGEFRLASLPPGKEDFRFALDYWERRIAELGIEVELSHNATVDSVLTLNPEVVILATGATRRFPNVGVATQRTGSTAPGSGAVRPSSEPEPSFSAPRQLGILAALGTKESVGSSVAVVGSAWAGAEAAELWARAGRQVTIVESSARVAAALSPVTRRWFMRQRLAEAGVQTLTQARVAGLLPNGLFVVTPEGEHTVAAETIVYEGERAPRDGLLGELRGRVGELLPVGDCAEPRTAFEAIREAFEVARRL